VKGSSWEEQKLNLTKQIQNMEERIKSLSEQNDLLHSQFDTVTSQAAKIQLHQEDIDSLTSSSTVTSSEDKTIKELRELIRFLRSDKDILECKYELVQQETLRYKQQVEFNQREIKELEERIRQVCYCFFNI
jgi:nucleoprotein TPR